MTTSPATQASARKRSVFGLGLITLIMVSVLTSLGIWQLHRRDEKHALIAVLTERLADAPEALAPSSEWKTFDPSRDEFRRVTLTGMFDAKPDAMVYSSGSAVREDVSGPGTWAFMPAHLPDGSVVVVNVGFVQNTMQDRAQQDRAVARLISGAPLKLIGYIRFPEHAGWFTPREDTAKRLWFLRDHVSMAQALGWGTVAPFYIDLEAPVPASGVPKPGPLAVHLKDDHMQYAITWFGLALVVVAAFGFWVVGQRRA